jgi:hypothetical protein
MTRDLSLTKLDKPEGLSPQILVGIGAGLGILTGVAYTLSPLTLIAAAALAWIVRSAGTGLSARERKWFAALLVTAIALRLALIVWLFLTADPAKPYAAFFGDEEIFKSRSLWIRNLGLGVPISPADTIYSYDATGWSGYLPLLAMVQALVGNAPYGLHVMNAAVFISCVLILYRLVRPAFGGVAAMAGLALLLFTPTMFVWSVSALKEPVYSLAAVLEMLCVLQIVRGTRWWHRVLAALAVVVGVYALEILRKGGAILALIGSLGGLAAGFVITRPRLIVATLILLPILGGVALSSATVQQRLLSVARDSAMYHAGHVMTPGYSYEILDGRYYLDRLQIRSMPPRDATAFVVRAFASYVLEPLPWKGDSWIVRAYFPELLVWWVAAALLPLGIVAGLRRDALLTSVLLAHGLAIMVVVALTSGNAGTLVRHRGQLLPYVIWLSALGGVVLARWLAPSLSSQGTLQHGDR